MTKINSAALISSLIICFIPAIIGGIATSSSVTTWYPTLIKPSFTPPNWLFGPAWTILYILQGISLYLIRTTKPKNSATQALALVFFYFQLFFNLLWSVFFFGFRNPKLGFAEIGLLDITVIFTIIGAFRVRRAAAYLLLPYLAWIFFATWLNFQIFTLNRL